MRSLFAALAIVVGLAFIPSSAGAKTYLPCNPKPYVVAIPVKPKRCTILPPQASFSEGSNLAKLRWSHWGKRRAYFRGIERGFHLPYGRYRVRGFAFRPRPDQCGGRKKLFTRVLIRWVDYPGHRIVKTQSCVGFD